MSDHDVDVLLTDWMMPGLDGPELCRRVRHRPSDTYVYIVLTTGWTTPSTCSRGWGRGQTTI